MTTLLLLIILSIIILLIILNNKETFLAQNEAHKIYLNYRDLINNRKYNKYTKYNKVPSGFYKISDNCFVDKYRICKKNSKILNNKINSKLLNKFCQNLSLDNCKFYGYNVS